MPTRSLMQALLLGIGCGLVLLLADPVDVTCPPPSVTLDLSSPLAWHKPSKPVQSVNEVEARGMAVSV